MVRIVAAMADDSVCPDGNEKSVGLVINSVIEGAVQDGPCSFKKVF
jgi:hypothetical protein